MSRQTVLEVWRELVRGAHIPEDKKLAKTTVVGRDDLIALLNWMIR